MHRNFQISHHIHIEWKADENWRNKNSFEIFKYNEIPITVTFIFPDQKKTRWNWISDLTLFLVFLHCEKQNVKNWIKYWNFDIEKPTKWKCVWVGNRKPSSKMFSISCFGSCFIHKKNMKNSCWIRLFYKISWAFYFCF
jgi:hypothetical protein